MRTRFWRVWVVPICEVPVVVFSDGSDRRNSFYPLVPQRKVPTPVNVEHFRAYTIRPNRDELDEPLQVIGASHISNEYLPSHPGLVEPSFVLV